MSNDLSKFDDYVFYADYGGEAFAIGLVLIFFYHDGRMPEKMAARQTLLESFNDFVEGNLDTYVPLETETPTKNVTPRQIIDHFRSQASDPRTTLGGMTAGSLGADRGRGDPHRFLISIYCGSVDERHSRIIAYMPAGWIDHVGRRRFVDRMREWAGMMGVAHGTVGLGCQFSFAFSYTKGSNFFPYLKRYVGLDMGDFSQWLVEMKFTSDDLIRTTNWLTFIDASFVDRLGGREKLAAELGDACDLSDYDRGLTIQAGPLPEVGDINQNDIPWRYRTVARALAPIRFEAFKKIGMFEPGPRFNKLEESKAWVRRFD